MSQCTVLFTVAFTMKMKGNEMGGWSEQGEGWRVCVGGGVGAAAFIFSAPHVIFIVNKTHLAFLSEQGLAGEASFYRERKRGSW